MLSPVTLTFVQGQNEMFGHHNQYWLILTVCPVIMCGYLGMLQRVEKVWSMVI